MSTMINLGKEMLRICPKDSKKLDYSINQGRTWLIRYNGNSSVGNFSDLMECGKELLDTTDRGLYYSINQGRTWLSRRRN